MISITAIMHNDIQVKMAYRAIDDLFLGPGREDLNYLAALPVVRAAQGYAPVDLGHLQASIHADSHDISETETVTFVGSDLPHADAMERGTGVFIGKEPHWPPGYALEGWARRHGFPSGAFVARIIGERGGLEPRWYLRTALQDKEWAVVATYADAIVEAIDNVFRYSDVG